MGFTAAIGAGLSLASLGMKAGSDVAQGYATRQADQVKATNAILQSSTQANNYLLQGNTAATNYQLRGAAEAANDRFAGATEAARFGLQSQQDLIQASEADTAAQFGKLQAAMTDAQARDSLRTTLGNISVVRAAGGADLTSPTTAALEGHVTDVANLNRTAAEASINAQTAEEKAASDYLHQASAFALTQGSQAQAMGEYNAENATNFANFNANAATTYANYNANTALQYGLYNSNAASAAGNAAVDFGYANAGSDILGGLGKAFSTGGFGLGGSGSSPGTIQVGNQSFPSF